jgi:hypothetical protein
MARKSIYRASATHTKPVPVINKAKQQKPVFASKPKNIETRIKDEHRYSFQSENNWQPIRILYFNLSRSQRRVHRISNFKSVFHRLLAACLAFLSQLDYHPVRMTLYSLLVTLLTTMPISISSVSSIVSSVSLLAPGNSLREPKS